MMTNMSKITAPVIRSTGTIPEKILDCFLSVENTPDEDIGRWNRTQKMNRGRVHTAVSTFISKHTTSEVEINLALMERYYESLGVGRPDSMTVLYDKLKKVKTANKRTHEESSAV
jgi:hypothetical protein